MHLPVVSYSVSLCESITSFDECHQRTEPLSSPKMLYTVQQRYVDSAQFSLHGRVLRRFSLHRAYGKNKKSERRVFMWSLWFLLQSASSLEIHFSCSSLTKAMFYSQHHKNSFLKWAKSAHFPPFSLPQILLMPCWLSHRGITSNLLCLHGLIRFLSWDQIQLL